MIRFLTSAVLLAFTTQSVFAQENNGCVDVAKRNESLFDVPFSPTGTPLLSRFGFSFDPGIDHHIQQLLIYPGLPNAMMRLDYSDKHPDDEDNYCFNITHFDLTDARIRQVTRGLDICSEAGRCTVRLDKPAGDFVFVLIGFQLSFRAPYDHHVKEVSILEDNGAATVALNDEHFDPSEDTFLWSLQYAYVPRDRFINVGDSSGSGANDRVLVSMPAGRAVLRGFRFSFNGDDHHLQQISVRPNNSGTAFVAFRDQNGDDRFDWEYRWAILRTLGFPPGERVPVGPINRGD